MSKEPQGDPLISENERMTMCRLLFQKEKEELYVK